ncbi:MAG TPA: TraR/DksA C4-type zinc finger protein [Oligoflexia bacterium]|nr:TraR/DksA C4-type zinc finger protein [Oligoflexia bacterium]
MDQKSLTKFKKMLLEERQNVLNHSKKDRNDIIVDSDDLADETDLAASEVSQALAFSLRDRERLLLSKIDQALEKIEEGTFGICETCEEPIEIRRLEARPVSNLCLSCKELEEHKEKIFA